MDTPTVDVLTFVGRRLAADAIVVLLAARGDEAIGGSGLEELHITPLDGVASLALVRQRAADLPRHTQERILRMAAGNPLALVELPASMQAVDQDASLSSDLLPLSARLERLARARSLATELRSRRQWHSPLTSQTPATPSGGE